MENLPSVTVLLIILLITILILCCPTIVDFGLGNEALINNDISTKVLSEDSSKTKMVEFSSGETKKYFNSFRRDTKIPAPRN